jgi:hypothetical protein
MRLTIENDLEIAQRGLGLVVGREEALAPHKRATGMGEGRMTASGLVGAMNGRTTPILRLQR